MAEIRVVFNGRAGDSSITPDELMGLLRRAGHDAVLHDPGQMKLGEFLRGPMKMVVAAGGDGTVGKIALALTGRKIPLGIIPLGTANNIAGSLGVSFEAEKAIHAWAVSDAIAYDTGLAVGPWRANVWPRQWLRRPTKWSALT